MAGALLEAELLELTRELGFVETRFTERFDSYRGTRVADTVSASVGVHGANFFARRAVED